MIWRKLSVLKGVRFHSWHWISHLGRSHSAVDAVISHNVCVRVGSSCLFLQVNFTSDLARYLTQLLGILQFCAVGFCSALWKNPDEWMTLLQKTQSWLRFCCKELLLESPVEVWVVLQRGSRGTGRWRTDENMGIALRAPSLRTPLVVGTSCCFQLAFKAELGSPGGYSWRWLISMSCQLVCQSKVSPSLSCLFNLILNVMNVKLPLAQETKLSEVF